MIGKRTLTTGLVGAVLVGGSIVALPGLASATPRPHSFTTNQKLLEQQLANRVSQLGRLATDVTGSKTLSTGHAMTLSGSIMAATNNLDALVTKVPSDTTQAQLNADRSSMLKQNRVFAVLTPQVFQTIEADSIGSAVMTFELNESSLQSSVTSIVGQHGYNNALNHYLSFVKSVNQAAKDSSNVATAVLDQAPANYPGDTHVFVHANSELLNADIALAHASYDESVIGLASGGYTGS